MVEYAVTLNRLECHLYHRQSDRIISGAPQIFDRTGHESDGSAQAADRRADGGRTPCK